MDDSEPSSCRGGTGKSFTPYVLRSIAVSPQPDWFENVTPSTTARGHLSYRGERMSRNAKEGENWWQGTPTERLVATWSRENSLFPTHRQHGQPAFQHQLQVWYYANYKEVR